MTLAIGVVVEPGEASHELDPVSEDGLDAGFDDVGELHDHIDGLSRWMRIGRARTDHRDD